MQHKLRNILYVVVGLVLLTIIFFRWGTGLYVDYLWFDSVGYSSVYLKVLFSELGLRVVTGIVIFSVLFINLFLTRRPLLKSINTISVQQDGVIDTEASSLQKFITPKTLTLIYLAASVLLGLFVSAAVKDNWITVQQFLNAASFGVNDPVFQRDVGFYVFQLPFYQLIYQLLIGVTVISALVVAVIYLFIDSLRGGFNKLLRSTTARYHLSALAVIFFAIKAWGYKLDQYQLLFSDNGAVVGAAFTDVHARLLALKILLVLSLIVAIIVLINVFMRRFRFVLYSIGGLVVVSILVGSIYPTVIQNFIVSPNELEKERPYIGDNIKFTQMAYNLDKIENRQFPAGQALSRQDIEENSEIINNIRLWDHRPLKDTYSQLQEIRPYYEFKNIDIDRYMIDGEYRQVMLSAREMNQSKLPERASTWINQRLMYTHGIGVAMSPVNEISSEGLPRFFLQNIPPVGESDLQIDRPQIYYGESTDTYVVVNTDAREFDYPQGDQNAYTNFEGESGVEISNIVRRGLLAFMLGDYRLFVASDINNDSQVLMRRNINERVPSIAPFLKYDSDPYAVVNEGQLYWMWDAYTTTNMFPYSDPFNGRDNYIRNSVKIVVDAYTGEVDFYVAEPDDPIVQTYSNIFPEMFKPLEDMKEGLQDHIRYPVDLYKIQAAKYTTYHMENVDMFYNKEDQWRLPTEQYGRNETQMEPYYTITQLPGEDETEFVLILPFTPENRNNMIAWFAARSDGDNYGKLRVYRFPKQELVYGPMQIEARINQDDEISRQISLWDQRNSSVIRGNLIVMPIKDSLLYVEPLYLQADEGRLPELRRVIVVHDDKVVMEPSLEGALDRIFSGEADVEIEPPVDEGETGIEDGMPGDTVETPGDSGAVMDFDEKIREANRLYREALDRQREGDWEGYGRAIQELEEVLRDLEEGN